MSCLVTLVLKDHIGVGLIRADDNRISSTSSVQNSLQQQFLKAFRVPSSKASTTSGKGGSDILYDAWGDNSELTSFCNDTYTQQQKRVVVAASLGLPAVISIVRVLLSVSLPIHGT